MTTTNLSLVNQKLGYARVLIQQLTTHSVAQSRLLNEALAEAAVSHLVCGFRHYLRELAEANGVKPLASIIKLDGLAAVLAEAAKVSAEMEELQQLQANPASWLAHLHHAYEQQWAPPSANGGKADPTRPAVSVDDENLIQLTVIEETPDLQLQLSRWYEAFSELVLRHRQNLAEY
jgi:hypothetical protein